MTELTAVCPTCGAEGPRFYHPEIRWHHVCPRCAAVFFTPEDDADSDAGRNPPQDD